MITDSSISKVRDIKKFDDFLWLESRKLHPSLKSHVWQLFSAVGEVFFKRRPPLKDHESNKQLLNLGCGEVVLDGFVNADFYRLHKWFSKDRPDWMLDITQPMKCDDSYWDGVILEHVNEHITYVNNYRLFQELYRTMKKGAVLRLVVPDLDTYLKYTKNRNSHAKMDRYQSLPEAISNLTQNHSHIATWNFDLLREVLLEIGFSEVEKCTFRQGSFPDLLVDSANHEWQSLYCEAIK